MIRNNKTIRLGIFLMIFLLLLLCNFMTKEIADDFSYHFSWSNGQRIDSIGDIIPSMKVHYAGTNGRVVAHFFAQMFEMYPKWVFNTLNAGLFTLMIGLMYYICGGKKTDNVLLLCIFGAVWIFTPAFGQVYLWLDGACNYLWGAVVGFLYLIPFVNDYLFDKPIRSVWAKLGMVIFAFFMGAYSENGSAAFVGISVLLQLAMLIMQKKRLTVWGPASVASACVGFYLMVTAPGTLRNKGGEWSLGFFRENFITALEKYRKLEILLIALCILLVLACMRKRSPKKIVLSLIFTAGSLAANFMMMAAAYYADRSMIFCTVLLVVAVAILFDEVLADCYQELAACTAAVLALYTVFFIFIGVNDIFYTGSRMRKNEAYIVECREQGIMDVKVPLFISKTKYSASNGLLYLSTETSSVWPNTSMAKYFEVNSVIGYWE